LHICLNCETGFEGNHCPNCGQKAHVARLNAKALLDEIVHFFTHIEETFFTTSLHFIIKPGITSLNYIEGKRKRYQKPISYFLIWAGLYIVLHNFILRQLHYELILQPVVQSKLQSEANILLRKHFTFFMLPILFFSAAIIWLVLARSRFYFIEIFTIVLYGCGTYFTLLIINDIILGVLFRVNINHYYVFYWQTIISFLYNIWFTADFFRRTKIRKLWLRILFVAILISITGYFVFIYAPVAWIYISH